MGDRVLIQLTSGGDYSPVLYLHSLGHYAPSLLEEFRYRFLEERGDDIEYAFARLVQYACMQSGAQDVTGVGVMNASGPIGEFDSQGDAGVMLADLRDRTVYYGGGYAPEPDGANWTWHKMGKRE